ncbi:hypothetical protein [Sorangium sp. So ce1024]|uniref:hypothetical protein n=1 Tax=Sorangium sp. So ce1024 TaxID=3133327 RepID=UPI003F0DDC2B
MATIPWPETQPGAWDTLFLAGRVFPGLAKVKVKGGQKIDRKDAPGSDGESTTQQGEKAKDVEIVHRMWTQEQWDEYEACFLLVEPVAEKRRPVDIVTSQTAFRLITSVIIEEIDGPNWDEEKRWMEVRYRCIEHKPPPPKNTTKKNEASQSTPGAAASGLAGGGIGANGRLNIFGDTRASVMLGFARSGLPGSPTA